MCEAEPDPTEDLEFMEFIDFDSIKLCNCSYCSSLFTYLEAANKISSLPKSPKMRMLSTFQLAKELAVERELPVRRYLNENREQFVEKLSKRHIFIYNSMFGVEMVHAADITLVGANQIVFGPNAQRKTVAQHQLEKGNPLEYPSLPCIAVHRSSNHYDYFPIELVFFVTA